MLNQIFLPGTFCQHSREQLARGIELVVAGEDDAGDLLFAVALGDKVAAEDLQPAIGLPYLFPQVGRAVALRIGRVASGAIVAQVEGQEAGGRALQLGGHHDRTVADGEVHQRAARKFEQGLG
ncbi:hypothetical protein D3C87_1287890 [compost metagenome]